MDINQTQIIEITKSATDSYITLHSDELKALKPEEFAELYTKLYTKMLSATFNTVRNIEKQREENVGKAFGIM